MVKHGLSPAEAAARFYVLDHNGLITEQASTRGGGSSSVQAAPLPPPNVQAV